MTDCQHKYYITEYLQKPPSNERFRVCSGCGKEFSSKYTPGYLDMTLDPNSIIARLGRK